ncbi:MAG TPA: hypothetical protein VLT58_14095 [Polyangia bacterium]|nr:hypothetical protein [Polyangia bacterium]
MKRSRAALLATISLAAMLFAARPPADAARERRFFSVRAGVGVEAPPGWTLSLHTGYPKILCLLVHPGGSRMSLAVDDAVTATDAPALVAQSRPALTAQGIEVNAVTAGPRGAVQVDARATRRNQQLRQLYIVRTVPWGRQAIVLTLTTTPADAAGALGSLEWAAAHLDLQAPVRPDDKHPTLDGGS